MRSIFLQKRGEGTQIYICNGQEEEEGGEGGREGEILLLLVIG